MRNGFEAFEMQAQRAEVPVLHAMCRRFLASMEGAS